MKEKDKSNVKKHLIYLVFAAMLAALTTLLTMFPKIPIPGNAEGYAHLGDAMIYIGASFLPLPYAMAAAAVGGTLADVIAGALHWAPWTFFIKALLCLAFTSKKETFLTKRNFAAGAVGVLITTAGYYLAESVMYTFAGALSSIIWNILQGVVSAAVYYALAASLDKIGVKRRIKVRVR